MVYRVSILFTLMILPPIQEEPPLPEGLIANGGSPDTEKAVAAGLDWLARHQDKDGRWDSDGFGKNCKKAKCDGKGFEYWDTGVTGLAILAFVNAGHTHKEGAYQETVKKGLEWIKAVQKTRGDLDGAIGISELGRFATRDEWVYNHAVCSMALCEAYEISGDLELKEPAQKALKLILRAQNPRYAWRYGICSGDNDTSVTGWMIQALHSAKKAGLEVPDTAFEGALRWLDKVTDEDGATGYRAPDGQSSFLPKNKDKYNVYPVMTAAGLYTRVLCGQNKTDQVIQDGARLIRKTRPRWPRGSHRSVNLYYWYYATYALFQIGGDDWMRWNSAVQKALLPRQIRKGDAKGSWEPVGEWGYPGGRVYSTAIAVLTLQIYYRHDRIE